MSKRFHLFVVVVMSVLALSLVGCKDDKTTAKKGESTSETTDSAKAASSISGTIRVVTSANSGRPGLEVVGPMFEEETDATLNGEFGDMGTPTYTATLMTELQNGTAADIFGVFLGTGTSSPNLGSIVEAGYAMDLSDTEYGKNAWEGLKDSITINGKIYGVCLGSQLSGIIYNTELFSEYGLQVPTDWDELLQLVAKINEVAPGKIPVAMAGGHTAMAMIAASMFIVNEPDFKTNVTSFSKEGAYKNGLQKILDLQAAGGLSPSVATDDTNAVVTQVVSNQAFMLIDLTSRYGAIKRTDANCPIEFVPWVAKNKDDAKMMLWPGTSFAVNAKTEDPETAIAFVNFMLTPKANAAWVKASGGSELSIAQARGEDAIPEQYKELAKLKKTVMIPAVGWDGPSAGNALGDGISAILSGAKTIEEVLADMDAK